MNDTFSFSLAETSCSNKKPKWLLHLKFLYSYALKNVASSSRTTGDRQTVVVNSTMATRITKWFTFGCALFWFSSDHFAALLCSITGNIDTVQKKTLSMPSVLTNYEQLIFQTQLNIYAAVLVVTVAKFLP